MYCPCNTDRTRQECLSHSLCVWLTEAEREEWRREGPWECECPCHGLPSPEAIKAANPWACWADCVLATRSPSCENYEEIPDDLRSVPACMASELRGNPSLRACFCGESVEWLVRGLVHAAGTTPHRRGGAG